MRQTEDGKYVIEQSDIDENTVSFAKGLKLPRTVTNVRPEGVNTSEHENYKTVKVGDGVNCKVDTIFGSETSVVRAFESNLKDSRIRAANTHFRKETLAEIRALSATVLVIDLAKSGRVANADVIISKGFAALQKKNVKGELTLGELETFAQQLGEMTKEIKERDSKTNN